MTDKIEDDKIKHASCRGWKLLTLTNRSPKRITNVTAAIVLWRKALCRSVEYPLFGDVAF